MTDSLAASRIRRLIGAGLAMTKLLRGNAGGYMPKYNLTGYTHLLVHHGDRYYAYPIDRCVVAPSVNAPYTFSDTRALPALAKELNAARVLICELTVDDTLELKNETQAEQ